MDLYSTLTRLTVNNWYLGNISALHAYSSGATIERKTDKAKIRRALKKIGYRATFRGGYMTITGPYTTGHNC